MLFSNKIKPHILKTFLLNAIIKVPRKGVIYMKVEVVGKNGFSPSDANKEYAAKKLAKLKDMLFEAASTFAEKNTKAIVKVEDNGKKKSKHKVLKVAGIIAGSVAVAATVAGVAVVKGKKRNKK